MLGKFDLHTKTFLLSINVYFIWVDLKCHSKDSMELKEIKTQRQRQNLFCFDYFHKMASPKIRKVLFKCKKRFYD
jgi:hypothetical protein